MEQRRLQLIINQLMKKGKKETAIKILRETIEIINLTQSNGLDILDKAITNCNPYIKFRSIRNVRKRSIKQPIPLMVNEQDSLAIRWILQVAIKERGTMSENLAKQFLFAAKREGEVLNKVAEYHQSLGI